MGRIQVGWPWNCTSVICFLIVASNIPACSAPARYKQVYQADLAARPDWVAGRQPLANTSEYILYANDAAAGMKLRKWLDEEIAAFRAGAGDASVAKGLVFAIEAGDEPDFAVREWEEDHVAGPYRSGEWTRFARCSARAHLYCLRQQRYFRESYLMTPDAADRLGLLRGQLSQAAWICFLTTDEHLLDISGQLVRESRRTMVREISRELKQKGALGLVLASLGLSNLMSHALGYHHQLNGFRSTDMDLMRIQRRDTIHTSLASAVIADESAREKYLTVLYNEVDQAWHDRWLRRPFGRLLEHSP